MTSGRNLAAVMADTNILVSGLISARGYPSAFVDLPHRGTIALLLLDELYAEYVRVLLRPRFVERFGFTPDEIADLLVFVWESALWVERLPPLALDVRDPKDTMVLATAVGGRARYLITGDADLLDLRGRPELGRLRIVTVHEFLETIRNPDV